VKHHRRVIKRLRALYGRRLVCQRNHGRHLWRWSVRELLYGSRRGPVYGPSIATGQTRREALEEAFRSENIRAFKGGGVR
jgi:hypothetical protein